MHTEFLFCERPTKWPTKRILALLVLSLDESGCSHASDQVDWSEELVFRRLTNGVGQIAITRPIIY
jgi:hypothetical protein